MAETNKLKSQRDRFLGFAFSASDLLMEVDKEGEIIFALGAARGLIGVDDKDLVGRKWLEVFDPEDQSTLTAMRAKSKMARRIGPVMVKLSNKLSPGQKALFTAIRMPGTESFYVTLSFSNLLMAKIARDRATEERGEILDKRQFLEAAQEALSMARDFNQDVDMTLLNIDNVSEIREQLGEEKWEGLKNEITQVLQDKSVDGETAARIGEGKYSILHDKDMDSEQLIEKIEDLSRLSDPTGKGIDVGHKTINADLSELSDRETTKALLYTISEFEKKGTELTIETLNTSFKAYVSANAHKISEFKSFIKQLNFHLYFQPIIDLENGKATHFEMLCRFPDGSSPYEWIVFGEDIGMAADFDLAVCDRAINYINYKSSGRRIRFAVNLSGQSMQDENFFKKLMQLLKKQNLSERLLFEITESTMIEDLDQVSKFVNELQSLGYKICLDDFGAGAASFQYLHRLHVDYVKIDGAYTRRMLKNERDAAMMKNLTQMCRDLDVKVVAEMVETQAQEDKLRQMGVHYAQGFLYSPAQPKPEYKIHPKQKDEEAVS